MQILNGKFTTDDDKTAVEAVLKTLIQTPSAENDDILVKVIISPEEIRPAMLQGIWQPAELRSRALDLVKLNPSESLSIKLADNLAQRGLEPNDPVVDFLLQDNPANLNAQLHLYQSEDLPLDTKTKLEQFFLKHSSQAIGLTMGIPLHRCDDARQHVDACQRPAAEKAGRRRLRPSIATSPTGYHARRCLES